MADQAQQSAEGRLDAAGFTQRLGFWVSPDGQHVMNMNDALAGLDAGEIQPGGVTHGFAVSEGVLSHVRITEERIRAADDARDGEGRPEPPPWLFARPSPTTCTACGPTPRAAWTRSISFRSVGPAMPNGTQPGGVVR
jgi:hypothetical protein